MKKFLNITLENEVGSKTTKALENQIRFVGFSSRKIFELFNLIF